MKNSTCPCIFLCSVRLNISGLHCHYVVSSCSVFRYKYCCYFSDGLWCRHTADPTDEPLGGATVRRSVNGRLLAPLDCVVDSSSEGSYAGLTGPPCGERRHCDTTKQRHAIHSSQQHNAVRCAHRPNRLPRSGASAPGPEGATYLTPAQSLGRHCEHVCAESARDNAARTIPASSSCAAIPVGAKRLALGRNVELGQWPDRRGGAGAGAGGVRSVRGCVAVEGDYGHKKYKSIPGGRHNHKGVRSKVIGDCF